MNIKFKDIESIISGLCCANAMLDAKIEELEEKGFDASDYRARKEKLKDSLNALRGVTNILYKSNSKVMFLQKYT